LWAQGEEPFTGFCFEVDLETHGKKYKKKKSKSYCRPPKKELGYIWVQDPSGPGGKCYEIDKKSSGKNYSNYSLWKNCLPENVSYELIEGKCYIYANIADGSPFLYPTTKNKCLSKELTIKFILSTTGRSGKCVGIDTESGETITKPLSKCKPKQTYFQSIKDSSELSQCYEIAQSGPTNYIKKVNSEKCRPDESRYKWRQESDFKGQCYLIGVLTNGEPYKEKAARNKCFSKEELESKFVRKNTTTGTCFLIDKETNGEVLFIKAGLSLCRPEKIGHRLVSIDNKDLCIEIDDNDIENGFRRPTRSKYCKTDSKIYRWVQDKDNIFLGKCIEENTLANGKVITLIKRIESCRPEKTSVYWHTLNPKEPATGNCYEIHPKGPSLYSAVVKKYKCKPKETTTIYLHPEKYKFSGCFTVDKETKGKLYVIKTLEKKCKQKFLKSKKQLSDESKPLY